jgi:hypothetical protein
MGTRIGDWGNLPHTVDWQANYEIRAAWPTLKYRQIVSNFDDGTFRPPVTPMTDQELGRAIAEYMKAKPALLDKHLRRRSEDPTQPMPGLDPALSDEPRAPVAELRTERIRRR